MLKINLENSYFFVTFLNCYEKKKFYNFYYIILYIIYSVKCVVIIIFLNWRILDDDRIFLI